MYECVIGCENNKVRFEPGDKVPKDAFNKKQTAHFLEKGVLKEPKKKKVKNG